MSWGRSKVPWLSLSRTDSTFQLARGSLGDIEYMLNKWPFQLLLGICHLPPLMLCFSLVVPAAEATQAPWRQSCLQHDTLAHWPHVTHQRKDHHHPQPHTCTQSHRAVLPEPHILDSEFFWQSQPPFPGLSNDSWGTLRTAWVVDTMMYIQSLPPFHWPFVPEPTLALQLLCHECFLKFLTFANWSGSQVWT